MPTRPFSCATTTGNLARAGQEDMELVCDPAATLK
jgi:hypothetical protein